MLDTIHQDLLYALRQLRRSPGFTALVVATLALGIGATTAIFSVVDGVLLSALPYGDPGRLVMVWENLVQEHNPRFSVSPANFRDVRARSETFSGVAAQLGHGFTLSGQDRDAEALRGAKVTANFFDVLEVRAARGRTFLASDTISRSDDVAVISFGLWQRRFAGDPGIVGRSVTLDGTPHRVVGVMPRGFRVPAFFKAPQLDADVWTPLSVPAAWDNRQTAVLQLVARLRPGLDVDRARSAMAALATRLERAYPRSNDGVALDVVPLREQLVGPAEPDLLILMGSVGLLLVIACFNLANLSLVRALGRRHALAVRRALGAPRSRLVRAALTESLIVGFVGGGLGLLAASWGTHVLVSLAPSDTPRLGAVGMNAWTMAFALALTVGSGLGIGLLPAFRTIENGERALLANNGRGTRGAGARPGRWRSALVVLQVALTVVLLIGAGLMVRTFLRLRAVDPGFEPRHVLTFRLSLPPRTYGTADRRLAFFGDLFDRLESLPGIRAAGGTTRFPLDPAYGWGALDIEGQPVPEGDQPLVGVRTVSTDYFRTLRIPLLEGRGLTGHEDGRTPPVALINQTMAQRFFAGEDPVGRRIGFGNGNHTWYEVLGVVGAVSHDGLDAAPISEAYLPLGQDPVGGLNIVVRGTGDPVALVGSVREVLRSLDPDVPPVDVRPMQALLDASAAPRRFLMLLLAAFGVAATALAALGIYGLLACVVGERRREIGIRMVLGAEPLRVLRLVLSRTAQLLGAGIVCGVGVGLVLDRVLAGQLYGVGRADPIALTLAIVVVLVTGLLAGWLPARRAVRIDPMEALRHE